MPKIVDVAERRQAIARALWRVAGRDGLAAASVRTVADEAGMSPGALRHYFSSQDELLRFAMETVHASAHEAFQALPWGEDPLENAALLLGILVPRDEESLAAARIWFAFAALAQTRPELAAVLRESHEAIAGACRMAADWVAPDAPERVAEVVAAEDVAAELHALVDGLALHAAYHPDQSTPECTDRLLRDALARIAHAR